MAEQYARGLWGRFAPDEQPFAAPNGMEDNIRWLDDHLGLYTLQPPVAPTSPEPINPGPGDGQIFTDGTYSVFNGGQWRSYPARKGLRAVLLAGTESWLNTGTSWEYFSVVDTAPAVAAVQPYVEEVQSLAGAAAESKDLAALYAEASQSGAGVQDSFAIGVGLSGATSGPASFFYVKKGGLGPDGVTPLPRQAMYQRTGVGTANPLFSILPAGEFDALLSAVERPDVAFLFGKVGDRSAGYVDRFARWFINTVGLHVGDVQGNATGVDGAEWGMRLVFRPDVGLAIIDGNGRGIVLVDVFGNIPRAAGSSGTTVSMEWPRSSDPVLAALKKVGATYRGTFAAGTVYRGWDVVADQYGELYLYTATSAGTANDPSADPNCTYLPLYPTSCFAVADEFDNAPGPAANRYSPQGYQWVVGGEGYANAVVGDGAMTSALNTYFQLRGLQGKVVEVDTEYSCAESSITHTIALSPNNLATVAGVPFGEMWHINWSNTGVGLVTYWHAGAIGAQATLALQWSAGKVMQPNVQHRCKLRFRGRVCFGYLDEEIAFIHVHEFIETMCSNANAMYVQNHYATAGVEKQYAVRVKVAEGSKWGRIAINAADPMSPLLLTADGSPEGAVQAPLGSKVFSKGGAEYRKATAAGMTGWT